MRGLAVARDADVVTALALAVVGVGGGDHHVSFLAEDADTVHDVGIVLCALLHYCEGCCARGEREPGENGGEFHVCGTVFLLGLRRGRVVIRP